MFASVGGQMLFWRCQIDGAHFMKGLPYDGLYEIVKSHGGKDDVCFKFNAGSSFCSFLTIGWGSCTQ